jgi:tRNA(His) 5'-end guanylyltransferase
MKFDLSERHKEYEKSYDTSIIKRLPIIIRVDGRGFSKLTRNVPKPYCRKISAAMAYAMFESIKVIDSGAFGYTQSDECSFILWPNNRDADPWFGNRIQKMCSVTASTFTYYFNDFISNSGNKPNIYGPALFDARIFALPSVSEVINNLIWRQQDCRINAVSSAAMAELGRKYGKRAATLRLQGKKTFERISILKQECDIDFEEEYPSEFKMGIATYKAPKIVETSDGQKTRTKWIIDTNPPDFINDRMFLLNYMHTGSDIFRPERDL